MNFNKIKEYCEQNGLSISDLAEKIGISKPGLYRSIQEESMKVETLENISKVLNVPIWFFFDLDPEAPYIAGIEQQKKINQINQETLDIQDQALKDLRSKIGRISSSALYYYLISILNDNHKLSEEQFIQCHKALLIFISSNHELLDYEKFQSEIKSVLSEFATEIDLKGIGRSNSINIEYLPSNTQP